MLSTEYAIQINGFTLFRDHADRTKYYYLPKGDVRIAGNGTKLNYFSYVDSSMAETREENGGYLTLEVELGPNDQELAELKKDFPKLLKIAKAQAIAEKKANKTQFNEEDWNDDDLKEDDFVLVPVQFREGDVKLVVLGEDSSVQSTISHVKIVGAQKPSLFGRQTAVFSVQLKGKEAEIMYQMLTVGQKDENNKDTHINSQIAVLYDLTYKGIEPAHFVKITIDFEATETYWNHHFDFQGNFDYDNKLSIAADVDVDVMFRDLMNSGAIVVQQIDYTGNNVNSPLGADDPSAIKLAKELMSDQLFTPTPLPNENYSALANGVDTANQVVDNVNKQMDNKSTEGKDNKAANGKDNKPADGKDNKPADGKDNKTTEGKDNKATDDKDNKATDGKDNKATDDKDNKAAEGKDNAPTETKKDKLPEFSDIDVNKDNFISKDEWNKNEILKKRASDFEKYAVAYMSKSGFKAYFTAQAKDAPQTEDAEPTTEKTELEEAFKKIAGNDKKISKKQWDAAKGSADDWKKYADEKFMSKDFFIKKLGKVDIAKKNPDFVNVDSDKDGMISRNEWLANDSLKEKVTVFDEKADVVCMTKEAFTKYFNDKNEGTQKSAAPTSGTECVCPPNEQPSPTENKASTDDVDQVFKKIAGEDNQITKEEWLSAKKSEADWNKYANEKFVNKEKYEEFKKAAEKSDDSGKVDLGDGVPSTVNAKEWKLGIKMGYSYKKRELKERIKRTYIFNKQTAMNYVIHPQGMLTVDGTDFDPKKQISVGRLGEGPFCKHEINFSSVFDFDAYHIEKILIDVNHVDCHGTVIELTNKKNSEVINLPSEKFRVSSDEKQTQKLDKSSYNSGEALSYKVSFIFKPLSIKGFDKEDKILIETDEKYVSSKVITIGPDDINGIYALNLQTGNLTLGKNIKSANIALCQENEGEGSYSVYNQILAPDTNKNILLNPAKDYKVQIQYNLEETFNEIPVTKKELTVTSDVLKASEFVVQDPTAGLVKITTPLGESTFDTIPLIEVSLSQNGEKLPTIPLAKKRPECYFVTDYNSNKVSEITVESIKAIYSDGSSKQIKINENNQKFLSNATEYILPIPTPQADYILITTPDGVDTFEGVGFIEVTLTQNGKSKVITLTKRNYEYKLKPNFDEDGNFDEITVESVVVTYRGGAVEELPLSEAKKKISTKTEEYVLPVV